MSILFAGTPQNAAETLRELLLAGTPISLVLTRPDAPIGRKAIITPSPVAKVAEEFGIFTIKSNKVGEAEIASFATFGIDFAIVVALGVMLNPHALEALPQGWFNLHYSLLPRWRGAAPVQHALIAGEIETGVTIFKIDSGLDTGAIVKSVPTAISPDENSAELLQRLTNIGVTLLLEVIPMIASGLIDLKPQTNVGLTVAPKLFKSDGKLQLFQDARVLANQIRGVTPEPGAWIPFRDEVLKVLIARAVSKESEVGKLVTENGNVYVGCGIGSLHLIEVQPAGKRRMLGADWFRGLNGHDFKLGENDQL